jgi:hypothetical protein
VDPGGGQRAAIALVTKHFGVDDGNPESWSSQKRRAYGGIYRYHTLSSIQRQKNWEDGCKFLAKALETDPTLAVDLDFFYDLVLSEQPSGYKDSNYPMNIENIFNAIRHMLERIFQKANNHERHALSSKVYGTAYYAMGLVAYNTGQRSLCRGLLWKAILFRPELLCDKLVVGNILHSFIGARLMNVLKKFFRELSL